MLSNMLAMSLKIYVTYLLGIKNQLWFIWHLLPFFIYSDVQSLDDLCHAILRQSNIPVDEYVTSSEDLKGTFQEFLRQNKNGNAMHLFLSPVLCLCCYHSYVNWCFNPLSCWIYFYCFSWQFCRYCLLWDLVSWFIGRDLLDE